MIGLLILLFALLSPFPYPTSSWAGARYEETLKQLAEAITERATKAKTHRLAFLDFTDSQGQPTAIGQFLAEELGTQIMLAGELTVVDRTLTYSTLKKLHVDHIDSDHAKAVQRVAKAIRADAFISGVSIETPDGLQVTTKLINPSNGQPIGAARATLPKAGPLDSFFKKDDSLQPVVPLESPIEPAHPTGLGTHRNEYYEFVLTSIDKQDSRVKLDVTITNHSSRDLKLLCHLQDTVLKDEHGTVWHQGVEENREGLCTRGLELSPQRKRRAVLVFTTSSDKSPSQFTLHFHEKLPRRDASFSIDGLTLGPSPGPADTTP
ncbi:MAG: FlgO family outer membrane protein [Nitrospira sp.]|nr:FlgO family outer membrane protein [Nitrospira sp.]